MRKRYIIFMCGVLCYGSAFTQTLYVDPVVTVAVTSQASMLKEEQKNTNNILTQIKVAEATVNQQLLIANQLQEKVYKGLSEVSSLLNDSFTVKQIYENSRLIVERSTNIVDFASSNPQFTVFATKEASEFRRRCLLLTADVTQLLTGGSVNLMNAGQRRELLRNIEMETALLAAHAWMILFTMENAKRIGFWRAANPFRSWVNRDAQIARDIIARSKFL